MDHRQMGDATAPLDGSLFPAQAFVSCDSLQDYSSAIPPGVVPDALLRLVDRMHL